MKVRQSYKYKVSRSKIRKLRRKAGLISGKVKKEKMKSPKYREFISNTVKKTYTPELRKLRSESAKKQMKDPKQRKIRIKKLKGRKFTDEQKINMSRGIKTKNELTKIKQNIIEKRGFKCQHCGKILEKKGSYNSHAVIHHIDGKKWNNAEKNLLILCNSCHAVLHNEISRVQGRFAGLAKVQNKIAEAIEEFGLDLNNENFKETPERISRVWSKLTEGLTKQSKDRLNYIFSRKFKSDYDEIVVFDNIKCLSMCPHHFLPIHYQVQIAYLPNGFVLGLSKLVEVIQIMTKVPKMQEDITNEIANNLYKNLSAKGVFVVIKGNHDCMELDNLSARAITTSAVRGEFLRNIKLRMETLMLFKENIVMSPISKSDKLSKRDMLFIQTQDD